ncbi:hypothetical protein EDB92DRAFT_1812861 [Lactarius akahatsu]|uniref:Uncharacterized protein n=1 Tax=Lactarius akahatsu TaxID=416441 RepID=A0AAD4QHF1_9AGAM|nr:hypothetical protein EDB92DRAFT_1812861 [Lactarius akahatsu]
MSPCRSYRSGTGSPPLQPLTSAFLDTLSLDDEFPRISGLFRPFSVSPPLADTSDDDDDVWYDADTGHDDLWTPLTDAPLIVADDTLSRRGVETSNVSVSPLPDPSRHPALAPTPRYHPLFPRHALERPKDPDQVEPTVQSSHERRAIVPSKHPLYTHIHGQKRRSEGVNDDERPGKRSRPSGNDADDEQERPRPQLAKRTHPLPGLAKYRIRPKTPSRKSISNATCATAKPEKPDRRPLTPDPPQYDWIRHHIAFCCKPDAKKPTYPIDPFPVNASTSSAVQGFRKRYRPIDMTKKT